MHQCLYIPEIVAEIAGNSPRRTNCKLALTCRAFYGPAMDIIWKSLETFIPMIECMPRDLLAVTRPEGTYTQIVSIALHYCV